jgi:hypothetical protein
MNIHRLRESEAARPAVAALVFAATLTACLWLAQYQDWVYNNNGGIQPSSPGWAIPVAIVVGVGGSAVAFLIIRAKRRTRDRRY